MGRRGKINIYLPQKAVAKDLPQIDELLEKEDMALSEIAAVEDYWVIREKDKIIAVLCLVKGEKGLYIESIVVDKPYRKKGLGRVLIDAATKDKDEEVTVIARGDAVPFYRSLGFIFSDWSFVPSFYQEQCKECPVLEDCHPQVMTKFINKKT